MNYTAFEDGGIVYIGINGKALFMIDTNDKRFFDLTDRIVTEVNYEEAFNEAHNIKK